MQRIKIPFGGLTPDQMDVLADLSEEYSDGILHVTTRQDFQLHFIHIEDTPLLMRRLAATGITTREACGNSVRNVTACPLAGVCRDEVFDVTPYAKSCARFLLGHPDAQDFGRKFKVAFSGCKEHACGLVTMHDMGGIAVKRMEDGKERRGFELYVGGGLGAVPHQAKLFDSFLPEEELLPIAQAISRVFARLGEKDIRSRARIKFLVAKLGIDEFRRLVLEERKVMPEDPRWMAYLPEVRKYQEKPLKRSASLNGEERPEGFEQWYETNVYQQRQEGYVVATINLPLGDLSAWQIRELADLARRFTGENVRITVEQNILFRWVSESDLPDLYRELQHLGLSDPGAGSIVDITACPGTDTCKLGIASSRGLAGEIRTRLATKFSEIDEAVKNLRVKISGCFNSCGLRAAPYLRHRFLWHQPHHRRPQGGSFPGLAGRKMGGKRQLLWAGHRICSCQADTGGPGSHYRALSEGTEKWRQLPGLRP
jgi:sulfite reductase (ferredoxin)